MARGPAYPYVDLKKAIEMTRKIYDFAKRSQVSTESLIKDCWEFSPKSSSGKKMLAALKYFGLLDEVAGNGHKNVILSDRAYRILIDSEDSPERKKALHDAALAPKYYKYCWDTWGEDFPPAMRSHLIFEKGFIDSTVDAFLRDYKATIKFAGLADGRNNVTVQQNSENMNAAQIEQVSDDDSSNAESEIERASTSRDFEQIPSNGSAETLIQTSQVRQEKFTFDEGDVILQWPANMSEDSFEDFSDWLELTKRKIKRRIQKEAGGE